MVSIIYSLKRKISCYHMFIYQLLWTKTGKQNASEISWNSQRLDSKWEQSKTKEKDMLKKVDWGSAEDNSKNTSKELVKKVKGQVIPDWHKGCHLLHWKLWWKWNVDIGGVNPSSTVTFSVRGFHSYTLFLRIKSIRIFRLRIAEI